MSDPSETASPGSDRTPQGASTSLGGVAGAVRGRAESLVRSPEGTRAIRITAIYMAVGALWIVSSDWLLGELVRDPVRLTELQTLKGWLYVFGSGLLIFVLVRNAMASLSRSRTDLAMTEGLLEQVAEQTGAVIFAQTPDFTRTLWATPSAEAVWGLPLEEMYRRPTFFVDLIHPEDRAHVRAAMERGEPTVEYRIVRADREVRWLHTLTSSIRDETGRIERVVGITEDVTARRRHEEELLFLAAAIRQTTEAVVIARVSGEMEYVNPAFERMTGYASADVIGAPATILKSERQDDAFYAEMWGMLRGGRAWQARFAVRTEEGSDILLDGTLTPFRSHGERITHIVAVLRDATHEAELEKQVLHGQKMEAVGRLAGGIAHDFNNVLTAIKGHAQFALEDLRRSGLETEDLDEVLKAADRAHDLTRQLLAFSRQQVVEPRVVDVSEAIRGAEKVLRRLIGEDVELRVSMDPDLGRVRIDPTQVDQVLFNLAINARDAMPVGGRLTIRAENVEVDTETAPAPEVSQRAGPYVRIRVADTGSGMAAETLEQIFEPFFTTKPAGRGTGLGLSTVFGIVEQNGGAIRVESVVGEGSAFEIDLPRTVAAADEPRPAPPALPNALTGSETILVVEDQPSVRAVVRGALERAGYRVLQAGNGVEALALWKRASDGIDLMISDLVMPHMGGKELAERMAEHGPRPPTLFMSGYAEGDIVQRGVLEPGMHLLEKPFDAQSLLRKVRAVLEAGTRD